MAGLTRQQKPTNGRTKGLFPTQPRRAGHFRGTSVSRGPDHDRRVAGFAAGADPSITDAGADDRLSRLLGRSHDPDVDPAGHHSRGSDRHARNRPVVVRRSPVPHQWRLQPVLPVPGLRDDLRRDSLARPRRPDHRRSLARHLHGDDTGNGPLSRGGRVPSRAILARCAQLALVAALLGYLGSTSSACNGNSRASPRGPAGCRPRNRRRSRRRCATPP